MKRIAIAALMAMAPLAAQAQSLSDKGLLGSDPTFQARVKVAVIQTALTIMNESAGTALHANRTLIAVTVLSDQNFSWAPRLAALVATDSTVAGGATVGGTVPLVVNNTTCNTAQPPVCSTTGNLSTQAALSTDASISAAVTNGWNSLFVH